MQIYEKKNIPNKSRKEIQIYKVEDSDNAIKNSQNQSVGLLIHTHSKSCQTYCCLTIDTRFA